MITTAIAEQPIMVFSQYRTSKAVEDMVRQLVDTFRKNEGITNRSTGVGSPFGFFNVISFVYNSLCPNVNSVVPPTRLPHPFCGSDGAGFVFQSGANDECGWSRSLLLGCSDHRCQLNVLN